MSSQGGRSWGSRGADAPGDVRDSGPILTEQSPLPGPGGGRGSGFSVDGADVIVGARAIGGQGGVAPAAAAAVFGDRVNVARRFVAILADTGVSHGLIGPREVPRLWDRHVLNCAVVAEAMPLVGARVIDVGSGAGLPGIALAIVRPDLRVTLVEPMLRRTDWLSAAVAELELTNVEVRRGRAEEFADVLAADYVTARAVAALEKLCRWCAPLVSVGGELVAMKGASAAAELSAARPLLARLGLGNGRVETVGASVLADPTVLVILPKVSDATGPAGTKGAAGKAGAGSKTGAAGGPRRTSRPKRHR